MAQVFISHVGEDSNIALAIANGLEEPGYTTWYYERDSKAGRSYLVQTSDAITDSQAVVVRRAETIEDVFRRDVETTSGEPA